MIGNDIVDLQLSAVQSNWKREGFLKKVFTPSEQELILSNDQDLMVWLLWSMKEAAYKAHQRRFSLPRQVNWQSQKCRIIELKEDFAVGVVSIQESEYYTASEITYESLHTIAAENQHQEIKKMIFEEDPAYSHSRILDHFSTELALDRSSLSI